VPAIDPNVLDCVFYIYPTLEDAKAGKAVGGTGFFVGFQIFPNRHWPEQIYAVTNRHCISKSGEDIVLRINKPSGKLDYLPTKSRDWFPHPSNLCDVAVLPLDLSSEEHRFNFISSRLFFLTPEIISHCWIGPGDDVFMIGRFIGQDGKESNLPTARFGNISRMNGEPIKDDDGIPQDSFLVEMRSMSGYSGSPVFVYLNPTLPRPPKWITPATHPYRHGLHGPWLLGIDWCHIPNFKRVLDAGRKAPIKPEQWVEVNSGMAGVIPAWYIQEILELPELAMKREEIAKSQDSLNEDQSVAVSDYAQTPKFTQSDFEQALRKASRRVPTSESDAEKK
jgi:hypothetical protein